MEAENKNYAEHTEKLLQAGYYLIELVSAVLAGRTPKEKPEGIDLEEIYKMAKRHSLENIAYPGAVQIAGGGDVSVLKKWQERSMQCAAQGMVQLAERPRLYQKLTERGIRILPLKGCIMKELYPRQEYRQMSDMDILIDEASAEKARDVMTDMGYTVKYFGPGSHDMYTKLPWLSVELHRALLPEVYENARKYDNIWEKSFKQNPQENVYSMTWDDFYIYMIQHFQKHFYLFGSGIRSVLDIHVFLQSKAQQLHLDYVEKNLKDLKLWEFEQNMRRIAAKWFKGSAGKTNVEYERLVILSGAYGTKAQGKINYWNKMKKKYHFIGLAKVVHVKKRLFPGYRHMSRLYPCLENMPFLLPVCWGRRLIRILREQKENVKEELTDLKEKKK